MGIRTFQPEERGEGGEGVCVKGTTIYYLYVLTINELETMDYFRSRLSQLFCKGP